jgi:DNA adenine methylase
LRGATLRAVDFDVCLEDVRQGDFVYLDPPYATSDQRRSGEYGYNSFSSDDIERLINCLKKIDSKKATFLLSYIDTPELLRLLPSTWSLNRINVKRHVAGFAEYRASVTEVLVSNKH